MFTCVRSCPLLSTLHPLDIRLDNQPNPVVRSLCPRKPTVGDCGHLTMPTPRRGRKSAPQKPTHIPYASWPPSPISKPTSTLRFREYCALLDKYRPDVAHYYRLLMAVKHVHLNKHSHQPPALVLIGPASCGKTTTLEEVYTGPELDVWLDKFTGASFVTGGSQLSREEAEEIDWLPRIRFRTVHCSDLNAILGGHKDTIRGTTGDLTRILDGKGYLKATGNTPTRPYEGDYRWALLGGCTPFSTEAWAAMSEAGPRLFFVNMRTRTITDGSEVPSLSELSRTTMTAAATNLLRTHWWDHCWGHSQPIGIMCELDNMPPEVRKWINRAAILTCKARAMFREVGGVTRLDEERPWRARTFYEELAIGNMTFEERTSVGLPDLAPVLEVAVETGREFLGHLCRALVRCGGTVPVDYFCAFQNMAESDATVVFQKAVAVGLGQVTVGVGQGRPVTAFTVKDGPFAWLGDSEIRDLMWTDKHLDDPAGGATPAQPVPPAPTPSGPSSPPPLPPPLSSVAANAAAILTSNRW